jgi:DNA-binding NarL/FixJ family response regulator
MGRSGRDPKNGAMNSHATTNLFVVEDSSSIRTRIAEMLARMPEVRIVGEAGHAPEAIAGILALRPHGVLLDLNLGATSGMEVLRQVRGIAPEITFVVLTNHAEPQYRRACERAGAAYFLDKTTEFHRVPAVITELAPIQQ